MNSRKSWEDSFAIGDLKKAASELMSDPVLTESKNEMTEIVHIMRGAYAKIEEAEKLLSDAGMYPEDMFNVTHKALRKKIEAVASPLAEMKDGGELKDADLDFIDAVDYSSYLWNRIEDLWVFYRVAKALKDLASLMDMELESYKDIQ